MTRHKKPIDPCTPLCDWCGGLNDYLEPLCDKSDGVQIGWKCPRCGYYYVIMPAEGDDDY